MAAGVHSKMQMSPMVGRVFSAAHSRSIRATGGLDYSRERAHHYATMAEQAIEGLPESDALAALRGLARYAVERGH